MTSVLITTLSLAELRKDEKKRGSGEREHGGAPLPDAVAMGLPAEAQGLWEDGALMEEEVEGGFMEEGLLRVVAGLMTDSVHAAGCL